ncbi:MAG TPA: pyridoxamine 5'-phosphate oxidase family protein, partial [Deltaproteobacteria bacterium]|nr:pyridoxamine 5'-phosphate oxidase family protein [Deltaproteobacteria bacterium]
LYLHSAPEGRKIDLIRKNPKVCFGVESTCEVVPSDRACSFTMRYESVVGKGTARIVTDEAEKRRALEVITGRYAHEATPLPEGATGKVTVIAVEIEELTGKRSGY